MLGLPQSTEVKRPLPKAQLYKRFDWKPSQRESFDGDVSRLDFVNWIAPRTLPSLDAVWQNIVASVGSFKVVDGYSLSEQIRIDDERARLARQIESLERLMRSTSQPRRQRELYSEIKKLKGELL